MSEMKSELKNKSGFLFPDGTQVLIAPSKLYSFCEEYCNDYVLKNDDNQKKFKEFSNNYKVYTSYYDFMLMELNCIHLKSFINPELYCYYQNGVIVFSKIPESFNSDDNYQLLKQQPTEKDFQLYPCDNYTLNYQDTCFPLNEEGFINQYGNLISLQKIPRHRFLAMTILNQLFLQNFKKLIEFHQDTDFYFDDYIGYMVYKLGYIALFSTNPVEGIYDQHLLSQIQLDFINSNIRQEYRDYIDNIEESPNQLK